MSVPQIETNRRPGGRRASSVPEALSWCARLAENERFLAWCAAAFVAAFLAAVLVKSVRLPLNLDELLTYHVAQQPSVTEVIQAVREGCDGAPPLYTLLVHAIQRVLGPGALSLRLPAALGVAAMCAGIFLFVRRRLTGLYAILAMLLGCSAAQFYPTEARPYGLVLGCTAAALVCWQAAVEGRRRGIALPGLFVALAAAISLHYFSIFVLGLFVCAEIVRRVENGRTDVPLLVALVSPAAVLVPHLPLIRAGSERFAPYFHSPVTLRYIPTAYRDLLSDAAMWLVFGLLAYACAGLFRRDAQQARPPRPGGLTRAELLLAGGLTALPVLIVLASALTVDMFRVSYTVMFIAGFAALFADAVFRMTGGRHAPAAALILGLLAVLGLRGMQSLAAAPALVEAESARRLLARLPAADVPILVANHHVFLELWYYAKPELRNRLVYATSPELSRSYTGADTGPLILAALAKRTPMTIVALNDFRAKQSNFLFLVQRGRWGDWYLWRLLDSGCALKPERRGGDSELYRAACPAVAPGREAL